MKFLVLGSSGMAGHTIALYLREKGHDVTGLCRRTVQSIPSISADVSDLSRLREIIYSGDFDVVINAIGLLNQAAEQNKDKAVFLNAFLPHFLSKTVEGTPTRVIHMSTDCVFRGNTGPYSEKSFPDGTTFYDRSKALGELDDEHNLTLRCSIVGPDINDNGIGLFNWFMKQRDCITGYVNALWTGLTTLELSKAMESCALEGSTGIINMVPDTNISKYELLQLFNKHFRGGKIAITPVDEPVLDKTLIRTSMNAAFRPLSYEKQVEELSDWVRNHLKIYPHYRLDQ